MKIGYNRRGRKNTHNPNNHPSSGRQPYNPSPTHTHALSLVSLY